MKTKEVPNEEDVPDPAVIFAIVMMIGLVTFVIGAILVFCFTSPY